MQSRIGGDINGTFFLAWVTLFSGISTTKDTMQFKDSTNGPIVWSLNTWSLRGEHQSNCLIPITTRERLHRRNSAFVISCRPSLELAYVALTSKVQSSFFNAHLKKCFWTSCSLDLISIRISYCSCIRLDLVPLIWVKQFCKNKGKTGENGPLNAGNCFLRRY